MFTNDYCEIEHRISEVVRNEEQTIHAIDRGCLTSTSYFNLNGGNLTSAIQISEHDVFNNLKIYLQQVLSNYQIQ